MTSVGNQPLYRNLLQRKVAYLCTCLQLCYNINSNHKEVKTRWKLCLGREKALVGWVTGSTAIELLLSNRDVVIIYKNTHNQLKYMWKVWENRCICPECTQWDNKDVPYRSNNPLGKQFVFYKNITKNDKCTKTSSVTSFQYTHIVCRTYTLECEMCVGSTQYMSVLETSWRLLLYMYHCWNITKARPGFAVQTACHLPFWLGINVTAA